MAHFAKLDTDNTVLGVHVVNNQDTMLNGVEDEATGIAFLQSIHGWDNWKQTSYNATIRNKFAGIGDTYDAARDAFIAPKPFDSWILNETTLEWEAPVTKTTYYNLEMNSDGTGPGQYTDHDDDGNPVEAAQIWNDTNQTWDLVAPDYATTTVTVNPNPENKYIPPQPSVSE